MLGESNENWKTPTKYDLQKKRLNELVLLRIKNKRLKRAELTVFRYMKDCIRKRRHDLFSVCDEQVNKYWAKATVRRFTLVLI